MWTLFPFGGAESGGEEKKRGSGEVKGTRTAGTSVDDFLSRRGLGGRGGRCEAGGDEGGWMGWGGRVREGSSLGASPCSLTTGYSRATYYVSLAHTRLL